MADLNSTTVTGRLTADATIKDVGQTKLVTFDLANNTGFGKYACTNYFKVDVWGKQGEALFPYLKKAKAVGVSGTMENKVWNDQEGKRHDSWHINAHSVMLLGGGEKKQGEEPVSVPMDAQDCVF